MTDEKLELSLDSTIKDILTFMVKKKCNPLILSFSELGVSDKALKIELIEKEVTDDTEV